ncbi:MAG: proline dehydrogenase family protein, partial [Bellilinea sp.]
MLRAFFIFLSKADWAQRIITNWKFAWRMASRFIAGETQEDALDVVRQLNQQGILATLDHLGENTEDQKAAEQFTNDVLSVLAAIHTAGLKSNVSIKLSQLGLVLDPEMAYANLTRILDRARQYQNFIRVDMEDSTLTEITLELVSRAKA